MCLKSLSWHKFMNTACCLFETACNVQNSFSYEFSFGRSFFNLILFRTFNFSDKGLGDVLNHLHGSMIYYRDYSRIRRF